VGIAVTVLKNPRHEAFAQALARGMSTSAAYLEAGYKANAGNACTLKSQQNISKRVIELQEEQIAGNCAPLEFSQGLPRSNLRKLSGFMSVLRGIGN
jgi:hypothetical protein